jgi:hypothetical protein
MKKACFIVTFSLLCLTTSAQNKDIQRIDSTLSQIYQWLEEDFLHPAEVTLTVNRPAIGPQNTIILFYWNDMDSEGYESIGEQEPEYIIDRELYMVTTYYNIAASFFGENLYLYDTDGKLIYALHTETTGTILEEHFYFHKGLLIQYIQREYSMNEEGEGSDMTAENAILANFSKEVLDRSVSLKEMSGTLSGYFFDNLFKIEGYWGYQNFY